MTITIQENDVSHSREFYDVTFFDNRIKTKVTHKSSEVKSWIRKMKYIHRHRLHKFVVGLDIEWRPNTRPNSSNPVATLQLCVGRSCLIFQLTYAHQMPKSLLDFLGDEDYTFVGVGIQQDAQKLDNDYGLKVSKFVDLRTLARARYGNEVSKNIGLKDLGRLVLGLDFLKPKTITMSHWDKPYLSLAQVKYACVDAFVSHKIGIVLRAWKFSDD